MDSCFRSNFNVAIGNIFVEARMSCPHCKTKIDGLLFSFLQLSVCHGHPVFQESSTRSASTCLKELCKICSVVLRHVNLDSLAESRQGKAGSALTLQHIK